MTHQHPGSERLLNSRVFHQNFQTDRSFYEHDQLPRRMNYSKWSLPPETRSNLCGHLQRKRCFPQNLKSYSVCIRKRCFISRKRFALCTLRPAGRICDSLPVSRFYTSQVISALIEEMSILDNLINGVAGHINE